MLRVQREKRIGRLQEQGKRNFEEKIFFVESVINPRTVEPINFFIEGNVCLNRNIVSAIEKIQHYIFSCAATLHISLCVYFFIFLSIYTNKRNSSTDMYLLCIY